MADAVVSASSPPSPKPNTLRMSIADPDISIDQGAPVTSGSNAVFARANAVATANVMGLANSAGEYPGGIDAQYAGPLTLTTAQWDARTGQTGGLTPHAIYYLSAASPGGKLTTTAPGNPNYITPVGFALSETTMMVQIGKAVAASP